MDELLDPLRSQGQWDSRGQFTLDSQQALAKMGRFALLEPRRYVLNLVSWAVAAGATGIVVKIRPGRLELEHDGASPRAEELRDLFASFGSGSLALQELAIGLAAAAALPGARLTVQGQDSRLSLAGGELKLERHAGAQAGLVLEEKVGWRWSPGWLSREHLLLREHCAFAEAELEVNGQRLNQFWPLPHLSRALLIGELPLPLELEVTNLRRIAAEGPFSALLGRSSVPVLPTPTAFLVRGVLFEEPPLPDLVAVVNAPELSKDLSQSRLVHNADFQLVARELERLGEDLFL